MFAPTILHANSRLLNVFSHPPTKIKMIIISNEQLILTRHSNLIMKDTKKALNITGFDIKNIGNKGDLSRGKRAHVLPHHQQNGFQNMSYQKHQSCINKNISTRVD